MLRIYTFVCGAGASTDEGSPSGKQLRERLERAAEALREIDASYRAAVKQERLEPADRYEAFFAVLAQDAQNSRVAIELVLAQPAISSQLIDNLNASMHLRALLDGSVFDYGDSAVAAIAGEGCCRELTESFAGSS